MGFGGEWAEVRAKSKENTGMPRDARGGGGGCAKSEKCEEKMRQPLSL